MNDNKRKAFSYLRKLKRILPNDLTALYVEEVEKSFKNQNFSKAQYLLRKHQTDIRNKAFFSGISENLRKEAIKLIGGIIRNTPTNKFEAGMWEDSNTKKKDSNIITTHDLMPWVKKRRGR